MDRPMLQDALRDLDRLSMLEACDADGRLAGLERLLEFALGPRRDSYGEPEARLQGRRLPAPLVRFYRFAGRWPSPHPDRSPVVYESPDEAFFYSGIEYSHLAPLDIARPVGSDRIDIFGEQSGNWMGMTAQAGADPPVWIQEGHLSEPVETEETLSGWLVAHCLAALAWETANSYCCARAVEPAPTRRNSSGLLEWFGSEKGRALRLWTSRQTACTELSGVFYLFGDGILVHDCGDRMCFAALTHQAAAQMRARATQSDNLE